MAINIYIPAEEAWSFFQSNKDRCSAEMVAIAENTDTEYTIYITEECGYPLLLVYRGEDEIEYEEGAISEQDCTDTVKYCYLKYLFSAGTHNAEALLLDDEEEIRQYMEDTMYEREDELKFALCDFLDVVLGGNGMMETYSCEMVDKALDHILEYIATELYLDVYRPMIVTDEELDEELYVEYPYDSDPSYAFCKKKR